MSSEEATEDIRFTDLGLEPPLLQALEELGYLLMSVVFLCLAPVFARKTGIERALRWLLSASFAMTVLALVVVSAVKGSDRGDTFEIAVISIVWLTLIAAGVLTAFVFRRAGKE